MLLNHATINKLISITQIMKKNRIRIKKLEGTSYAISQSQELGRGSFAKINRAYDLDHPQEELAAKVISSLDPDTSATIKSQLKMLKHIPNHPNLVNCKKLQISSNNNFYLIMEYCNQGNLDQYLYKCKYEISEERIWFFLKQFTQGYKVLYDAHVVHRDLKPQNILIHDGNFKIADFGLAKVIENCQMLQNLSAKGTPLYMAPELQGAKQGNSKCDVFSLGVMLYKMAFKNVHPFFERGRIYRNISDYFKQLKLKKLIIPKNHTRSNQLVKLITRMLEKDNEKRIGWPQIFQNQRIKKAMRYQRKIRNVKEMKTNFFISNRSFTKVEPVECQQSTQNINEQVEKTECYQLTVEQTFNKSEKSNVEKKMYHNKLLYTLIDYTNDKMIDKLKQQLPTYLKKHFHNMIINGYKFCLVVIKGLELLSGNWQHLNEGEILSFQDIFENDRLVLIEKMKTYYMEYMRNVKEKKQLDMHQVIEKLQQKLAKQSIKVEYQDALYMFLTQFYEYPPDLRQEIQEITAFAIDIFDIASKFGQKFIDQSDKIQFEIVQDGQVDDFYQYLLKKQKMRENQIKQALKSKGLIFL